VRLEVRAPTRLVIEDVEPVGSGSTFLLTATVADAHGVLDVGDASLSWTVSAPLRVTDRCQERHCLVATSLRVVADRPGEAIATVRFQDLEATSKIVVNAN
jgi:hypothetical protein